MSLKYEKAVINAIIEDFSLVLCFLADIFYFDINFNFYQLIGSAIVVVVSMYVTLSK
jgi:hypothetical protein